jgi:hypothetical protein
MCVQRFDDSLNSAIHTTYRISLRSSSLREPRDPLLKVVSNLSAVARAVPRKRRLRGRAGPGRYHQAGHHETREARRRSGPAVRLEPQAGAANGGRGVQGRGRGAAVGGRESRTLPRGVPSALPSPSAARGGLWPIEPGDPKTRRTGYSFSSMILPQVHLRKPCYDFYFL